MKGVQDATVTTEPGSDTALKIVLEELKRLILDARTVMTPRELLEHAANGTSVVIPKKPMLGAAANARALMGATNALNAVVAAADSSLSSLLCRQLYDRAIAAELKREQEEMAAFKDAAQQVFQLADADGSGALEFREIRDIASSAQEADAILQHLDQNSDGLISEEEWLEFFSTLFTRNPGAAAMLLDRSVRMIFERDFMRMCEALFHEFDKDGSGSLELHEVLVMMGDDEQGKELLMYADDNGDKSLSIDEWMMFFQGFWRYHPQAARRNVNFLMGRAAELRMLPAMPPRL